MSNELGNEWESFGNGNVPDELTLPNKAEVMNYVYSAVQHYLKQDRDLIVQLQAENHAITNALNVLLACLERGIPVREGKVTLGVEEMQALVKPLPVN